MLNADSVKPLVTKNTVAVLGVHLWGGICPHEELQKLCQERGIEILYDAAHAFGTRIHDRAVAELGKVSSYSFHATKVLNAAEGGCVTTDDDMLACQLRELVAGENAHSFGFNARMSPIQLLLAEQSLVEFESNLQHNKACFERYQERLSGIKDIEIYDFTKQAATSNFQYLIVSIQDTQKYEKLELMAHFRQRNVLVRDYFCPPVHKLSFSREFVLPEYELPNTMSLSNRLVQLPIGQGVTLNDVDMVCDYFHEFCHLID